MSELTIWGEGQDICNHLKKSSGFDNFVQCMVFFPLHHSWSGVRKQCLSRFEILTWKINFYTTRLHNTDVSSPRRFGRVEIPSIGPPALAFPRKQWILSELKYRPIITCLIVILGMNVFYLSLQVRFRRHLDRQWWRAHLVAEWEELIHKQSTHSLLQLESYTSL